MREVWRTSRSQSKEILFRGLWSGLPCGVTPRSTKAKKREEEQGLAILMDAMIFVAFLGGLALGWVLGQGWYAKRLSMKMSGILT